SSRRRRLESGALGFVAACSLHLLKSHRRSWVEAPGDDTAWPREAASAALAAFFINPGKTDLGAESRVTSEIELVCQPYLLRSMSKNVPHDDPPRSLGPSTLAVHAGEVRQKFGDSITDPIFCAATYTFADTQSVIDFIEQKLPREEYGRYG